MVEKLIMDELDEELERTYNRFLMEAEEDEK